MWWFCLWTILFRVKCRHPSCPEVNGLQFPFPMLLQWNQLLSLHGSGGVQRANRQSQLNLGRPSYQTSGVTGFVMQPKAFMNQLQWNCLPMAFCQNSFRNLSEKPDNRYWKGWKRKITVYHLKNLYIRYTFSFLHYGWKLKCSWTETA